MIVTLFIIVFKNHYFFNDLRFAGFAGFFAVGAVFLVVL